MVDEHTEYFKSHIDNLPPQERKVFVTLADIWNPASAREIADLSRISVNTVSAHLQRLLSRGAVVVAGQKGRKKWYQVAERMYNIYHLMRRRGEPSNRVRAIVDFMIHFYMADELVELTKIVAAEACGLSPMLCEDHYRFIEEILKRPQTEKFRDRIIEEIPPQIRDSLHLPQYLLKGIAGDESKTESAPKELTKEEIETGILKRPDDPDRLSSLALKLIMNHPDRIEEAKAACQKAISIDSTFALAWGVLGSIFEYHLKNYEEAEKAYKQAIKIDPEDFLFWLCLGDLLMEKLEKYQEAEAAYVRASEIDPNDARPFKRLGGIYFLRGQFKEAERAYRTAIQIDPENASYWADLGDLLLLGLENNEEAEKAFRRAIEIDSENGWSWGKLGHSLSSDPKRHKEAEEAYRRAIEINPEVFAHWANLGNLLKRDSNRYEEAEAAYRNSIELEPTILSLWGELMKLQIEPLKAPEEELKTAEECLEINERSADSLDFLARFFFETGQKDLFEKAEAWSREAIEKDKENPAYSHTLTCILGGRDKWEESLKVARQFLGNKAFIHEKIKDITDYFINAAATGHAADALHLLEPLKDIPSLEPIIAGLKIFVGEEFLTAQEIREIGQDVAERIRERMNNHG
ncbi:MAG: tetratricopeptide repeat protein [Pseudomonadota bacterium]